jgi:hypothetical protein
VAVQDSLYLEELEEGSPLELCYVLGKLQEKGAAQRDVISAHCLQHATAARAAELLTGEPCMLVTSSATWC